MNANAIETKRNWLHVAEVFDAWRVVPRVILFGYGVWATHLISGVLGWYEGIPVGERGIESAGLAGGIITAITGLFPWVYRIYSDGGRDWNAKPVEPALIPAGAPP